eukprot:gnl/MRDRNA2_/MRDRNA2_71591_c0_seq3.p1 gnl/MRDRNA2_/MRDRNA2_71591_c0~~gnl/MRDRNA2_/MRDRNA2_71591_c0_seq3.p1  ORF type:complete len:269 (-),score=27.82 gnl/MRDRNA2_/MRDRNA2_71591_c0_seq3:470-1276(-)
MRGYVCFIFSFLGIFHRSCGSRGDPPEGIQSVHSVPQWVSSNRTGSFLGIATRIQADFGSASDVVDLVTHEVQYQSGSSLPAGKAWALAIPVLGGLGLACAVVILSWLSSRMSSPETVTLVKHVDAQKPLMIRWFSLVFLQALVITILQVMVGAFVGSLSLLADCIHGAMDAISYSVGTSVEIVKSQDRGGCCGPKRLDLLGAFANLTTLLVTSIWVSVEAFEEHSIMIWLGSKCMSAGAFPALGHWKACLCKAQARPRIGSRVLRWE